MTGNDDILLSAHDAFQQ